MACGQGLETLAVHWFASFRSESPGKGPANGSATTTDTRGAPLRAGVSVEVQDVESP